MWHVYNSFEPQAVELYMPAAYSDISDIMHQNVYQIVIKLMAIISIYFIH